MHARKKPARVCGLILFMIVLLVLAAPSGAARRSGNYLIVTPPAYVGSTPLNQLIAHKTAEGFTVMTYEVPSGTHRTAIRTHIQDLWGTPDAPDYVLIVGDTDGATSTSTTIPHWSGGGASGATTDLPYACMDAGDDWLPDLFHGRLSVRTASTLQDIVDKIICVETCDFPDPEYVKRAAWLASSDLDSGAEETHDWVIENYFEPAEYENIRIYAAQGGNTQDIFDAVNNGVMFVTYGGHSGSSGWWAPAFDQGDVQALSNANLYPVVFGWSCSTAHYEYDECFGETWLRVANRGAAAYISASTFIYFGGSSWEPNRRLEKYYYESFFVDDIWELGPAWQAGLYRFLDDYGYSNPITRNVFEMFVLFGDPSLLIPKGVGFQLHPDPESLAVCSPPTEQAVYTIDAEQHMGFDEPITLSASGEPPSSTVSFSLNNVPPPFTTEMTVSNIAGCTPGQYTIEITGTATELERRVYVDLHLADSEPGPVYLTSPPDGANDIPRSPTLVWEPSDQAASYLLEIATDANFSNIAYSAVTPYTSYTVSIYLETLTQYFWHVMAENGCGDSGFSETFSFITLDQPDYFTEQFTSDFDLEHFTLCIYPDGSGDHYGMCGEEATEFPTDPAGGTPIYLSEDGYQQVFLSGGQTVELYGVTYSGFYICDNGYITFEGGDSTYTESLSIHFNQPRISALFDDLSAPAGGTISWRQLDDRAAVTYENVPEWGTGNNNTFQVEMFFDGAIHITWLNIDSPDGIVGISAGDGMPPDYLESDLSQAGSCGPRPPEARNGGAATMANTPVTITLVASDDGLPEPPSLGFIIDTLPEHGQLSDPGAGPIETVPYTLVDGGNEVVYTPDEWFYGDDSFTFKANDGGQPPEGGDSNIATISIEVILPDPELVRSYPLDSDPGWSTEGQWAFGQPTGGGSHNYDPLSGHTGANVYGYNLAGDYANNIPEYHLTTTAIDCSSLLQTELRFWRWLGVERAPFDHASIQISNDGATWTSLWENPASIIADSEWTQMAFDISAIADGEQTVYIRWTMGPMDESTHYPGWNIDDVAIWGVATGPLCPGDLDDDGDIDLADLAQLLANYGMTSGAQYEDGDIDADGDVDLADLAALLAVYGTTCE